jgi:hypothetical protein
MKPRKHNRINHANGACSVFGIDFATRKIAKKYAHRFRSKRRSGKRWTKRQQKLEMLGYYDDMVEVLEGVWAKHQANQQLNDETTAQTGS